MTREWNGSVYRKGPSLYIRARVFGKWKSIRTPYVPGQEAEARDFLRETRRRALAAGRGGSRVEPATVKSYAEEWLKRRRDMPDKRDVGHDAGRLRKHVLPHIGSKRLKDLLPGEIRDVVDRARKLGLAPKTVRNVYATIRMMMNDAVVDGLLLPGENPCVLTRSHLPPNRDKNPRWRGTAVFDRSEIGMLVSDPRIAEDRRVYYSVLYFTGMRLGEASGLRIEDYEPSVEPLARILVSRSYDYDWTKTGVERSVPVHPELQRILKAWVDEGWEKFSGRVPKADDLMFPTPRRESRALVCEDGRRRGAKYVAAGSIRNKKFVRTWFLKDLAALGLRHRRVHDFRRSMISHARSDGADRETVEKISHQGAKDVLDMYTTLEWKRLCEELGKLAVPSRVMPAGEPYGELVSTGSKPSPGPSKRVEEDTPARSAVRNQEVP
jgi:integrase